MIQNGTRIVSSSLTVPKKEMEAALCAYLTCHKLLKILGIDNSQTYLLLDALIVVSLLKKYINQAFAIQTYFLKRFAEDF